MAGKVSTNQRGPGKMTANQRAVGSTQTNQRPPNKSVGERQWRTVESVFPGKQSVASVFSVNCGKTLKSDVVKAESGLEIVEIGARGRHGGRKRPGKVTLHPKMAAEFAINLKTMREMSAVLVCLCLPCLP